MAAKETSRRCNAVAVATAPMAGRRSSTSAVQGVSMRERIVAAVRVFAVGYSRCAAAQQVFQLLDTLGYIAGEHLRTIAAHGHVVLDADADPAPSLRD